MLKRLRGKQGITLVEVVIAMSVVLAVTVAAVSLFFSATIRTQKTFFYTDAQYFAADALACFRTSENAEQFADAMTFRGGYSACTAEADTYTFTLEGSGYSATVLAQYPETGRPVFQVTVTDRNGETVTQIASFTKGDTQ